MRYGRVASATLMLILFLHAAPSRAAFHFSDPTTYKPASSLWSTAIADFDGDGRQDVAVVADSTKLFIYFSKAGGGFAPVVKVNVPFPDRLIPPMVAADLDGNGRAEMALGLASGIALVHVDSARHVTAAQVSGPFSNRLSFGDVDGDGFQDVVSDSAVYYGDASGNLGTGIELDLEGFPYPPVAIAVADMNQDGHADLVATNDGDTYVFYGGAGGFLPNPKFVSHHECYCIQGLVAADFNSDGRDDIAMGEASNSPTIVSTYYQDDHGDFTISRDLSTYDIPMGMFGSDVDKDGLVDLLVMHDGWASVGVYFQNGAGLADEVLYPSTTSHLQTGMALGDVDGDDCTDMAVANPVQGLQVRYGLECATMDMAVAVGLTATTATVRVENESANGVIDQPVVEADLSVRVGSMQLTAVPDNCVPQQVSAAKTHVECLVDPIAAGQSDTLLFGFQASPRSIGNRITIAASAHSPAKEANPGNNSATKWINFWPAPSK